MLTNRSEAEIEAFLAGKPVEAKKQLAADIVAEYHGTAAAEQVIEDWRKQFVVGGDPDVIPEVVIPVSELVDGVVPAAKLIALAGLVKSNSEGRKKIEEGAFNFGPDREKPAAFNTPIGVTDGLLLRLGRKIVRVKLG